MKKSILLILLVSLVLISACTRTVIIKDDTEIKLPANCNLINNEVICEDEEFIIPDNCYIVGNEVKCTIENQEITPQNGVLYGKVSISDCNPLALKPYCQQLNKPEDYILRKIIISRTDLPDTSLAVPIQIEINEDGYFVTNLQPGTYKIDINYYSNKEKSDKSLDAPKTIVITPDKITRVDISIYHD